MWPGTEEQTFPHERGSERSSGDSDNLVRLSAALVDLDARIRSVDDPTGIPFDPHPALMASMAMLDLATRCGNLDLAFAPAGIEDYAALSGRAVRFELDRTPVTGGFAR